MEFDFTKRGELWVPRASKGICSFLPGTQVAGGAGRLQTTNVFTQAGSGDSDGWTGYTLKQRLAASLLTGLTGTPIRFRAYVYAGAAQQVTFDACYVGHQGGGADGWDSTGLVQLLFSGGGGTTVAANSNLASDWAAFVWNKVSDIVLGIHISGAGTADNMRSSALVGATRHDKAAVNEAATGNATGYSTTASIVDCFLKVDIEELV